MTVKSYVAVELNNAMVDGEVPSMNYVNDIGQVQSTPSDAWDMVNDTFDPESTVICELIPTHRVEIKAVALPPIRKEG